MSPWPSPLKSPTCQVPMPGNGSALVHSVGDENKLAAICGFLPSPGDGAGSVAERHLRPHTKVSRSMRVRHNETFRPDGRTWYKSGKSDVIPQENCDELANARLYRP